MTRPLLLVAFLAATLPAQVFVSVSDSSGAMVDNGGKAVAGDHLIWIAYPRPLPPDTTLTLYVTVGDRRETLDLIGPRKDKAKYKSAPGEQVTLTLIIDGPAGRTESTFKFVVVGP